MIVMASILALSLVGIADSLYLLYEHLGHEVVCLTDSGCSIVDASPYSEILGVPVSGIGLAAYVSLCVLAAWGLRKPRGQATWIPLGLFGISLTGLIYSVYLTYLELFVIYAVCSWCVVSAAVVSIIFALSLVALRDGRSRQAHGVG